MKSFILSTLLMTLPFGESIDSKLNCEALGCNYYPQEGISKLIKCNEDRSRLSVSFNGDNGCSNWDEYIDSESSSTNNRCCHKGAMKPALKNKQQESLIVGGARVSAGNYPFIAYFRINDGTGTYDCGGSIIRKEKPAIILTAAHCVKGINTNSDSTFVRLGANMQEEYFIQSWIYKVVVHPQFDGHVHHGHDVALLFLSTDISTYPDDQLMAVTLNQVSPECCNNGDDLQVIGYGQDFDGIATQTLELANIKYIPRAACNSNYKYPNGIITETMLCAQLPDTNSCKGDSGGPLIRKGTSEQVGIVSWSWGRCADPDYPSTYVDVGYFYNWIQWYIVNDWN